VLHDERGSVIKLVIIGGVAGGASAAARARRLSADAQIIVLERGPDVSFANCGLPYYIGGEITERDNLLVVTPDLLRSRFNLDVRVRTSAEAINRTAKKLRVRDLATGREYEETFDKVILATGAAPFRPSSPGIDLPGVFTLRNLQETDRIKERVDRGVKQAVLLGHCRRTARSLLSPTWGRCTASSTARRWRRFGGARVKFFGMSPPSAMPVTSGSSTESGWWSSAPIG
jgi:NADPH-dependent 2,4-dienoyl-CoA reductase/sulfur reductase-like enzyme